MDIFVKGEEVVETSYDYFKGVGEEGSGAHVLDFVLIFVHPPPFNKNTPGEVHVQNASHYNAVL